MEAEGCSVVPCCAHTDRLSALSHMLKEPVASGLNFFFTFRAPKFAVPLYIGIVEKCSTKLRVQFKWKSSRLDIVNNSERITFLGLIYQISITSCTNVIFSLNLSITN